MIPAPPENKMMAAPPAAKPWGRPAGVPGIAERDFVGASHSALLEWLRADYVTPEAFHRRTIEVIEEFGATHNQRALLVAVLSRIIPGDEG